ncbi:ACHN2-like protein [Mya arenaria]|uniref:ACHN2-like protein n=1 Tax=Mya arenaria TaxID=6604 RepID=A0ABY7DM67_MYAAR|nr:ACHN2-like protein [Mya arenaria]
MSVSYNKMVRPFSSANHATHVTLDVILNSLNDFDELSGLIDITCTLEIEWTDDRLTWDPFSFGNISSVIVPADDIWRPDIYVLNVAGDIKRIGDGVATRVHRDGRITWNVAQTLTFHCGVDVTFVPFDHQVCNIIFSAYVHMEDELRLQSNLKVLDVELIYPNAVWNIQPAPVINGSIEGRSYLTAGVDLKRKSQFVVIYIIVPLGLLGLTNMFAFLIPNELGERNSVAGTTFLTIVVFMSIINEVMPQSSSPTAYIFVFNLCLMIQSSIIMIVCTLISKLYDLKSDPNDSCIPYLVCMKKRRRQSGDNQDGGRLEETKPLTWTDVGRRLDVVLFILKVLQI